MAIAVLAGLGEVLENDRSGSLSATISAGFVVERAATALRGDGTCLVKDASQARPAHCIGTTDNSSIRLSENDGLHTMVDCNK